jgi:predicted DNA-binding transcriptional regulator YafY
MRRSDRLFDLIQILRDGRLHRATDLADRMEVSVRTVWRDMATLMASGLPVEGERGVGYILRAPFMLPPLVLSALEVEALRQGLRQVADGPDATLARAARALAAKIATVTTASADGDDDLFVLPDEMTARAVPHVPLIRQAIRDNAALLITSVDPAGAETQWLIRPEALETEDGIRYLRARTADGNDRCRFPLNEVAAVRPAPDGPSDALPETRNTGPAGS